MYLELDILNPLNLILSTIPFISPQKQIARCSLKDCILIEKSKKLSTQKEEENSLQRHMSRELMILNRFRNNLQDVT